ncbi:flagellar basal-body MS-ring/collar protein FliF [Amphibiibacter pelophylacis]|uniref:Flagellar basal-body MS-ring/collar protein FliF n=1 Tax=Amphibiibacter pelophylacis TaxID=1799477 RepID=A0ACC6NZG9_9BURK
MSNAVVPASSTSSGALSPSALPTAPARPAMEWVQRVRELPPRRKWSLAAAMAGIVAIVVALLVWQARGDYSVLFSGLDDKSAGDVVAQLGTLNVPYRIGAGGAVLVPATQVHELRMKLASAGLPKSATVGFELMDAVKFGQTQTQERINIQRALEGELTRTIGSLDAVESARVHIALPNQNGFFREQQKPSASVMLNLRPGRTLDPTQLAGIVHLVASSVPELSTKAVSVIDQTGTLLTADPDADGQGALSDRQLKYSHQVEDVFLKRIQAIIEPLVGKDNYRATVTADIDFSQSEQTSEEFRPNQTPDSAAVRSSSSVVDSTGAGSGTAAGVPGATSNQPPVPATAPVTGAAQPLQAAPGNGAASGAASGPGRRENTTNYELDKTVRVTRNATGLVRKVNAAVVLNQPSKTDAKGNVTSEPVPQAEIDRITSLVQEAIGFDSKRGDSVKVMSAPFRTDPGLAPDDTPLWQQPWLLDTLRSAVVPLVLGGIALALFLGVVRPIVKATVRERAASAPAQASGTPGGLLSAVVDDDAPPGRPDEPLRLGIEGPLDGPTQNAAERLLAIRQLAKDNPAAVANIVREWVNQPA